MGRELYSLNCTFEGNGEILDGDGDVVWQVTTLHRRRPIFCTYGLLRDPGCAIKRPSGDELLMVTRLRQFPLPRFAMFSGNELICSITQRSLLLNKYSLDFGDGETWIFKEPLLTPHFRGSSDMGGIIQVREWAKQVWYVSIEADCNNPFLVCALAFIHRERLRFA